MVRFAVPLIALLTTPALAQTAGSKPPAGPVSIKDAEKRVCRAEIPTGSIMAGKKVCHTRAEWAAISKANGDKVDVWRTNQAGGGWNSGGS